jgi:hypothetical protein
LIEKKNGITRIWFTLFKKMEYLQTFLKEKSIGGQHGSHYVYWIPLKIFNSLPIKRWKHNRPPDSDRVQEIHTYMSNSKRMDGIVYLASTEDELVCYESNHRREALKGLTEVSDILVDILWDTTDDVVKSEFLRLNKCVSVPELYVADEPVSISLEQLRGMVDDFSLAYKSHKVTTSRPQRPNFSRDMLMDEFYRVIKENKLIIDDFISKITHYNQLLMNKDRSSLTQKTIDKCTKSGLWLFAWSSKLDESHFI